MKCVCEGPGYFNCGHKGILARVENGEIRGFYERCDACKTYKTDEAARQALLRFLDEEAVVSIRVKKKDTQKQVKELEKYLAMNDGHLEKTRLKAFEGILNLLVKISLEFKEKKNVPYRTRKTH